MTTDAISLKTIQYNYRIAANSYLKMSDNAQKSGLKDEQTVQKNESRYDLDGTLKEEHLPIGSLEKAKKKQENAEKIGLDIKNDKTDKAEKNDKAEGNILDKDVRGKEIDTEDAEKDIFGRKKDGFLKDPPNCQCETCRKRRYQDDSDDSVVSFQAPTTMSPTAARSKVRSHELEHVRRESMKARQDGKKIVSQTVTIKTDTCPECGRVYVSGGLTRTVTRSDMRDFHEMFMLGFDGENVKQKDIS